VFSLLFICASKRKKKGSVKAKQPLPFENCFFCIRRGYTNPRGKNGLCLLFPPAPKSETKHLLCHNDCFVQERVDLSNFLSKNRSEKSARQKSSPLSPFFPSHTRNQKLALNFHRYLSHKNRPSCHHDVLNLRFLLLRIPFFCASLHADQNRSVRFSFFRRWLFLSVTAEHGVLAGQDGVSHVVR